LIFAHGRGSARTLLLQALRLGVPELIFARGGLAGAFLLQPLGLSPLHLILARRLIFAHRRGLCRATLFGVHLARALSIFKRLLARAFGGRRLSRVHARGALSRQSGRGRTFTQHHLLLTLLLGPQGDRLLLHTHLGRALVGDCLC